MTPRRSKLLLALIAVLTAAAVAVGVVLIDPPQPMAPDAPDGEPGASEAAVVPAADARPWEQIVWLQADDPTDPDAPIPQSVRGVATDGTLVVVWGSTVGTGRSGQPDEVAVSRDGRAWHISQVRAGVPTGEHAEIHLVAVGGTRGLLAFGRVTGALTSPAAWQSATGSTWSSLPLGGDLAGEDLAIYDVVAGTGGWLLSGETPGEPGLKLWFSTDGSEWRATAFAPGEGASVSDIAATDDGFIAVGSAPGEGGGTDGAVWTSEDGVSWIRTAAEDAALVGPAQTSLHRVIPFAGGLFVLGDHAAPIPPACQGVGCGAMPTRHYWLSQDGTSFERIDSASRADAPTSVTDILAGGPGLVVIGHDTMPGGAGTQVWTSRDGRSWQPVEAVGTLPARTHAANAAVLGRRLVVLGSSQSRVLRRTVAEVWVGEVR